ncbi:cellulose-binding protein [Methylocystis sp. WRRC1]|uniref:hypothetical protein n=1 Tax=unclassified Methylocystis TaxID=2625913 RepID=UPI0001F87DD3|nr:MULTISPECIES: hypothetical protein [unclassified Methylocystis]MCC3245243.1 cellulose-binding protein [Methylocystis sp. WRRC1]
MRRALKISLGLALLCALASGDALAKSRKQPAPAGQVAANNEDDFPIALPKNLTTNKDWLDDGAASAAAQGKLRPNARANDRYFLEQQDFADQDPLRYSEYGSVFDGW